MDFSSALNKLKAGKRIAREGWNGKGMWLVLVADDKWHAALVTTDGLGAERLRCSAFIGLKTAGEEFVPWVPSQTDLLAMDWAVVEAVRTPSTKPHATRSDECLHWCPACAENTAKGFNPDGTPKVPDAGAELVAACTRAVDLGTDPARPLTPTRRAELITRLESMIRTEW